SVTQLSILSLHDALPISQHVHVRIDGLVDTSGQALTGDAGEEVVVGDPVGSLDEDRSTVDGHGEGGAVLVGFGVDGDRAKADPSLVGVDLLIVVGEGDGEVVQGLIAVSDRPPQRRVGNLDDGCCGRGPEGHVDGDVLPGDLGLQSRCRACRNGAGVFDVGVHLDTSGAVGVDGDQRTHTAQSCGTPTLQTYGPPDPGGLQIRSPVPSEG